MLKLSAAYSHFKLIAIDPGLNNIGIAIFEASLNPFKIVRINAQTLQSHRVVENDGLDDECFPERAVKRYRMLNAYRSILERELPHRVVCESPFFDRRKPGSFAILTEIMVGLFDTLISFNPNIPFSTVEPLLVKHTLGVAGQKGKDVVREAMVKQKDLLSVLSQDINKLDEHAIDAIGVGYTYLLRKTDFINQKEK